MGKLTPKQLKFCDEYLVDLNATQAAIRAGYSRKSAFSIGIENLKKPLIQAKIEELRQSQQERTQIDADWVVEKLSNIAKFEVNQIGRFDGNRMIFKPESDWDIPARTAVSSVKQTSITRITKGGEEIRNDTIEFKIESKQSALDSLGKYLGMFDNFNTAIATLKTYGINIRRDVNNDWIIDKGE